VAPLSGDILKEKGRVNTEFSEGRGEKAAAQGWTKAVRQSGVEPPHSKESQNRKDEFCGLKKLIWSGAAGVKE
jgi:hypothetical protein